MNIKKLDINLINHNAKISKALIYLNNYNDKLPNLKIIKRYPFINAVGVVGSTFDITKLSYLSSVEYICSVSKIHNFDSFTDNNLSFQDDKIFQNNLTFNINNNYAKNMYNIFDLKYPNSSNFSVCVLDTGVCPHIDLCFPNNRLIYQKDFTEYLPFFYDDNGHGTFVSGVISSSGILSGKKIMGVSPRTKIISVKIMNSEGESDVFSALDGMQWIADNYKKYNIKVVCMSFGATPLDKNDPLVSGVNNLISLGISVVCASGNSGKDTFMSPAVSSRVISVGSVDSKYNISRFTSYGEYEGRNYPDIYAFGEDVVSLSNNGSYVKMSGTSVACPKVCGVVCNILSLNQNLTPNMVKSKLITMAKNKDNIKIIEV